VSDRSTTRGEYSEQSRGSAPPRGEAEIVSEIVSEGLLMRSSVQEGTSEKLETDRDGAALADQSHKMARPQSWSDLKLVTRCSIAMATQCTRQRGITADNVNCSQQPPLPTVPDAAAVVPALATTTPTSPTQPTKREVAEALSDVTYLNAVKLKDEKLALKVDQGGGASWEMSSLSETRVLTLAKSELRQKLMQHNTRQLTRIYPMGTRIQSSNMDATDVCAAWNVGSHMVALNYQTWDAAMHLNSALFLINGGSGYVLQPPLAHFPKHPTIWPIKGMPKPRKLRILILSGQDLPKKDGERCIRSKWDDYHPKCKFNEENLIEKECRFTCG